MKIRKATSLGTALLVAALGLAGCSSSEEETSTPAPTTNELTEVLASHGLEDLDAAEIVDALDQTPVAERPDDLLASVRPSEVVFTTASGEETPMALPEDQFYLSFAPYVDQTHDCYFHSLTTCMGELSNEDFDVQIVDADTGETIVDETLSSFDNGFVGVWLPKGIEAELNVEHEGKSGSVDISTISDDDATCLTTLQLS